MKTREAAEPKLKKRREQKKKKKRNDGMKIKNEKMRMSAGGMMKTRERE